MLRVMQRDEAQSTLAALRKLREALDIRGPRKALRKQFSNHFLHLPLLGMELRHSLFGRRLLAHVLSADGIAPNVFPSSPAINATADGYNPSHYLFYFTRTLAIP